MASGRDDEYLRLKQSVDDWVSEVTQARTALTQSLKVRVTQRPAFRLHSRPSSAPTPKPASRSAVVSSRSGDDARAFQDAFTRHAQAADHRRRERDEEQSILHRDLEFAREQLHVQNQLRAEAVDKHAQAEQQYDQTVHLLGRAQISVDELRRQLRGKEWALEKAMAALESRTAASPEAPKSSQELHALQRESAALHSRLETLTAELQQARDRAEHEREAAATAKVRLEKLDAESKRSKHIVESLSKQVQQYAETLRETGRELDAARQALGQSGAERAPARGGLSDEQSEILRLRLAERSAADNAQAAKAAERAAIDQLSESVADAAVLLDNYDALAASHMTLREEVAELQQRIIERDHELAALKAQLNTPPSATPDISSEGTDDDVAQEWLVSALRAELMAERESHERSEMDHELLRKALTQEVEGLRGLATERDLVIHHQAAQLEAAVSIDPDAPNGPDAERREAMVREIQLLRNRVQEKDATVRRLRGELAEAEEHASTESAQEIAELEAALRTREDDLARTRDRVEYLRRILAQSNLEQADRTKHSETVAAKKSQETQKTQVVNRSETKPAAVVSRPSDIDVSQYQTNAALQREVEQSLAFQSMWPILAVVGVLAGLGVLGLAVLLFLVA